MLDLPEEFKERMKLQLGGDYGGFVNSYGLPAAQSA